MSQEKRVIEVCPNKVKSQIEIISLDDFVCPECHGYGGFSVDIGKDQYKWDSCSYCRGTGKINAEITIQWLPFEKDNVVNLKAINNHG